MLIKGVALAYPRMEPWLSEVNDYDQPEAEPSIPTTIKAQAESADTAIRSQNLVSARESVSELEKEVIRLERVSRSKGSF